MTKYCSKNDQNSRVDMHHLMEIIRRNFRLDWQGVHGAAHWGRVLRNGMLVAANSGADTEVVRLFALLHDSCREDEWEDEEHGHRAAELACKLRNRCFEVSDSQFTKLVFALSGHSSGGLSKDVTVQTCWDADRLDLGRVGIVPNKKYLSRYAHPYIDQSYEWSIGLSLKESHYVAP